MDAPDDYALLDIGDERRLERFGPWLLDRPALTEGGFARRDPEAWAGADARFDRAADRDWWTREPAVRTPWATRLGGLAFEIRLAPSGQVGCFPEQASNWTWIGDRIGSLGAHETESPEILHLFAHTGGSTLAAVRAGARVVHVDAGRPTVAWARRNAELNGWAAPPVRWIVDDALAFTRREARRGRRYAGLILDPPSFGHGPGGRPWRLETDLPDLLSAGSAVLAKDAGFVVLSAHTPGFDGDRLAELLGAALGRRRGGGLTGGTLAIDTASGRRLELGAVARWEA